MGWNLLTRQVLALTSTLCNKPSMPKQTKSSKPELIRHYLQELEWSSTRKYVEILRSQDELLAIDDVDVDVPQIIRRHFLCDAKRCIQWAESTPIIDRSCCARYAVPVSSRDRMVVREHLPHVRQFLAADARLQNPEADPFKSDEEFGFEMVHDNPLGGCQFNLYLDGHCRCALHWAALDHGENPHDWKPLACSLWPLALNSYDDDEGEERLLLTVYCKETMELFAETDEEPFACIVDQNPTYPRLYQAERSTLEYIFSHQWWQKLDDAAHRFID